MRNSISVLLVVIAIIMAIMATFTSHVAIAHGANLSTVQAGGSTGLILALIVGLMGLAIKPSTTVRISTVSVVAPTTTTTTTSSWPVYVHEPHTYFEGYVPGEEGALVGKTWADVMPVSTMLGMAEPEELPFVAQPFLRRGGQCTGTMYLRKG